jgi:hypothetical protein
VFRVDGDAGSGGFFPEGFGGPVGEVTGVGGDAAEGAEALLEAGGEAQFDAQRLVLRIKLDDVEAAGQLKTKLRVFG